MVVCACDMPYLTGELLAWLSRLEAPLAVASAGGRIQPLLGRYSVSLLGDSRRRSLRRRPMREVARRLGAQVLGRPSSSPSATRSACA